MKEQTKIMNHAQKQFAILFCILCSLLSEIIHNDILSCFLKMFFLNRASRFKPTCDSSYFFDVILQLTWLKRFQFLSQESIRIMISYSIY